MTELPTLPKRWSSPRSSLDSILVQRAVGPAVTTNIAWTTYPMKNSIQAVKQLREVFHLTEKTTQSLLTISLVTLIILVIVATFLPQMDDAPSTLTNHSAAILN